ncbi:MAG: hypothetical protein JSW65_01510 [Candidatus Bipolaricaulota bacterium]|nr:MAG: hypothetical protein JSW65_01510 [Candidatus Bipolaricaulota bacterium]
MTDEGYGKKLDEIYARVDEEIAKAKAEMKRHREARQERDESDDGGSRMPSHIPLPDVDKVSELLGVVADKIPELLGGLRDVLYSPAAAENMADAVAKFYKKLIEAGIPEDQALDMARGYMINLRDVLGKKGLDLGGLARSGDDG